MINMTLTLDCLAFSAMRETSTDGSGTWFQGCTQKPMSLRSKSDLVWSCLMMSCVRHSFWSSFSSLCDNLLKTVLFHVQLTCDHSNSQLTITTHHLPYPLDVDHSPTCWRPPAPRVIFHFLVTLFEPLIWLKISSAQHGVISIHLLKHFKCFWWSF